ncbi:hypothetical protein ACLVWU_07065 [Bdellovibrio sp. HCB290]|uniref:hypothetical protein n=1 Tax=Bdellovibrio sp. HCB290 TaxID=3394356 RepID=UPI0039B4A3B3
MKAPLSTESQQALIEAQKNFRDDFVTSRGFFTEQDEKALRTMAFEKLDQVLLKSGSTSVTAQQLRETWNSVVADFHRNNYWGFKPTFEKRPKVQTEEKRIFKEMFPYIWVIIQSSIILKTAVYYFGIRSSNEPTTENRIYLILALATSAGTLIFFAWRKSRK